MDGRRPWQKDHAEASFPRPPKRQKTFQDDWGNGIYKSQNASPTSHDHYTIAWICALHIEMAAAHAMLDNIHETLPTHVDDSNAYILGNIKQHNVVVACLPEGRYGLNNAANVLTHLVRTFPSIRAGLMVGIGGGVPSKVDIRLGDIVVGTRVMQYDLGKIVGDGQMQHTAIPKIPHQLLGTAVSSLRARHEREGSRIPFILRDKFEQHSEYRRPASPDCLFLSTYEHVSQTSACDKCDHSKLVRRRMRETDDPLIHYGAIASGNQVMRSGTQRDSIAQHLDVICFEMEAAGLMDILPCLPIRGICDYSDSHKNKEWQRYAAAAAASYARELLTVLPVAEARVKATYMSNPHRDLSEGSQSYPAFSSFDGISRSNPLQMLSQSKITAEARAHAAVENGLVGEHAPHGTQSISTGNGPQFPGSNFHAPVYFNTKEQFDPLRECLQSLAFPEMDSRFHDIDTAAKGTCEWLLRHQIYTSWASCDRGLLWIKGKPGSGKSTLLQYALTNIVEIPNIGEGAIILSFFFHGRGSELQKSPLGLFRSLLHQLLRQVPKALTDLVDTFQQRCETAGKPGEQWQWHPRELHQFFELSLLKVLETYPVWLFVDALDECGKENAVELADKFHSLVQRLPSSDLRQFRICFTCRHYPILDLDGVFNIHVEDENRKDISTFVQNKLSSFRVRTSSAIPDLITERAEGTFLWAWLIVKKVLDLEREGAALMEIEAKIHSVPQELDNLYSELIRNLGPGSLKLIQWVCFATRPLTLDELRWALVIDTDCTYKSLQECQRSKDYISGSDRLKRRVQTLSCGLAEVTSDGKVIQFVHQSVKDFFVEKGLSALNESAQSDLVVRIAHHRLSRTCIRYLAMEEIGRLKEFRFWLSSDFPFLHYATTSWVAHTKQSDARSVPQGDLLEYFAGPSNTLMKRWVRIYRTLEIYSDDCPSEGTSLVHVMSRYGVAGALWAILRRADQVGINIDAEDSQGRTPLWMAAENGDEAVVRLLLERGAHTEAADEWGWTPLYRAAENGHEAVVRLLLERGACTKVLDKDGRTPLAQVAANEHEAVVRLLLEQGAHTEAADMWEGRTPLWMAAGNRYPAYYAAYYAAVVKLHFRRRAHIDKRGQTPLSLAAANGHEAVVRLLLERGAHTEAADMWEGRTPLWMAAGNMDGRREWGRGRRATAPRTGRPHRGGG
ncbi:hypothetical protein FOVG_01432 [Fusarium oxysporum f. sp. pisi HDV247]|uniref:Uncharacterized protein n=1 Tax=Fusarium oxysporum f. sp. pisi HDV247 TaxID=1080344 RepID=W9Q829_FUSOX|nr:hypothetical protein FOVG_01432 [Fusarium oxysporum f. sp. pisi HDV247]